MRRRTRLAHTLIRLAVLEQPDVQQYLRKKGLGPKFLKGLATIEQKSRELHKSGQKTVNWSLRKKPSTGQKNPTQPQPTPGTSTQPSPAKPYVPILDEAGEDFHYIYYEDGIGDLYATNLYVDDDPPHDPQHNATLVSYNWLVQKFPGAKIRKPTQRPEPEAEQTAPGMMNRIKNNLFSWK